MERKRISQGSRVIIVYIVQGWISQLCSLFPRLEYLFPFAKEGDARITTHGRVFWCGSHGIVVEIPREDAESILKILPFRPDPFSFSLGQGILTTSPTWAPSQGFFFVWEDLASCEVETLVDKQPTIN